MVSLVTSGTTPTPVVVTPVDGPSVTSVARFGFHALPTSLVLTFNEAIDPARAVDVNNYRIVGPRGRKVAIRSALYDPTKHTVTLEPAHRLNLHRIYRLTVIGTGLRGIADTAGNGLDGARTGRPGSDSVSRVTAANLILGAEVPGGPARLARLRRIAERIAAHEWRQLAAHHLGKR